MLQEHAQSRLKSSIDQAVQHVVKCRAVWRLAHSSTVLYRTYSLCAEGSDKSNVRSTVLISQLLNNGQRDLVHSLFAAERICRIIIFMLLRLDTQNG